MKLIENKEIGEKIYIEKLENGMEIVFLKRNNTKKKFVSWTLKFGSIHNKFKNQLTNEIVEVPDGIAHYLEHKLFENENGKNSLEILTSLGLEANAYTSNTHTSYYFSGTDNFYKGLDELADYMQNPYFTDENVEKERGIIEQEIGIYDDIPDWKLYMNTLKAMYKKSPLKIDIAGTAETIANINKENLYFCYNNFYSPNNSIITVSGDFEPDEIFEEIRKRITLKNQESKYDIIYENEPNDISEKEIKENMDVNVPLFSIGIKINEKNLDIEKYNLISEIMLEMLIGKTSKAYQDLYKNGNIISELEYDIRIDNHYSHIMIQSESRNYEETIEKIIVALKKNELQPDDFNRIKKKLYGGFIMQTSDSIGFAKYVTRKRVEKLGVFEYFNLINQIKLEDIVEFRKMIIREDNIVQSIVI